MASFSLSLLGGFQVERDGATVAAFESNKVRALLAYLAVERERTHPRAKLATLLWPDHPEAMARSNLRHVLHQLRHTLTDLTTPLLLTTYQTVECNPNFVLNVDVSRFTELLAACAQHSHPALAECQVCIERYRQAAQLYQGDFLAGLSFYGSEPFEEWAVIQREYLHRQALTIFFTLAAHHAAQGDYDQAQHYVRRQLELEPWSEEAHRQLMRILAYNGQRSAALAQYNQCRKILTDELGVDPDAETVALYEEIRTGDLRGSPLGANYELRIMNYAIVRLTKPPSKIKNQKSKISKIGEKRRPAPISTVVSAKANNSKSGSSMRVVR